MSENDKKNNLKKIQKQKEVLKILKDAINKSTVRKHDSDFEFGLIEYYSFLDVDPSEILSEVRTKSYNPLAASFRAFKIKYSARLKEVNYEKKYELLHIIKGVKVEKEDIEKVKEYIEKEGFPHLEGIYVKVLKTHLFKDVNELNKDNTRKKVLNYLVKQKKD